LDAHRPDSIVASIIRHHFRDQQHARGSTHVLNSYAGLVQLE